MRCGTVGYAWPLRSQHTRQRLFRSGFARGLAFTRNTPGHALGNNMLKTTRAQKPPTGPFLSVVLFALAHDPPRERISVGGLLAVVVSGVVLALIKGAIFPLKQVLA